MRSRSVKNIFKIALVGILLTAFVAPNAMAASYTWDIISQVAGNNPWTASWTQNYNETVSVSRGETLEYINTFYNYGYGNPDLGPCDLYRLSSTDPAGGLNPSLSGADYSIGLEPTDHLIAVSPDLTISSSAQSGMTYILSTSHYYYPDDYPGQVYYPNSGAVKAFTVR